MATAVRSSARRRARFAAIPVFMAAGLAFGYWLGKVIPKAGRPLLEPGWALAPAILAALFLAVAVHELGHVAGGWLSGYRFFLYVAGPLRIYRDGERIRIGWNRFWALAGGLASMIPPAGGAHPRDMLRMVAGGPAASWLLAASGLVLFLATTAPAARAGALLTGLFSLAIGVATLIPASTGGFQTDGARILLLLRGGPEAERWCAASTLAAAQLRGVRPRDWDSEVIRRATTPADGSYDFAGAALLAYAAALDRGEIDEAGRWLDAGLAAADAWPPPFRGFLYLESAYFEGRHRARAAEARAALAQVKPGAFGLEKYALRRAEAAVLLAEGDPAGAARAAREGLAALEAKLHLPGAAGERELLEDLVAAASRLIG